MDPPKTVDNSAEEPEDPSAVSVPWPPAHWRPPPRVSTVDLLGGPEKEEPPRKKGPAPAARPEPHKRAGKRDEAAPVYLSKEDRPDLEPAVFHAAKNRLLNFYQVYFGRGLPDFSYSVHGPDHAPEFFASVDVSDLAAHSRSRLPKGLVGHGTGKKRVDAESCAALDALEKLVSLGVTASMARRPSSENPKVVFNEVYQRMFGRDPRYEVEKDGQGYAASLKLRGHIVRGRGLSKAAATQDVARQCLARLGGK